MNILNLVNRSLKISDEVKNSNKVFIFNGINATSETLLQNLLFRLENHEPNSIIYIKQTEQDTIENSDSLYSWYPDDAAETSKAFRTALKFSDNFRTPVNVIGLNAKHIPINDNHTSVIFIDTEGALSIDNPVTNTDVLLYDKFKFTRHQPMDIVFLQGYLTENEEILSILKSNPESINVNSLTGEAILAGKQLESKAYMLANISNEYDRAYLLAARMMNSINTYITERMKLGYSKSITNQNTLETDYFYFNKELDLYTEFSVADTFSQPVKAKVNKLVKQKYTAIQKVRAESNDLDTINLLNLTDTYKMLKMFLETDNSDIKVMLRYSYKTETVEKRHLYEDVFVSIKAMAQYLRSGSQSSPRLNEDTIINYNIVFYEILTDMLGGSFTW